MPAKFNFEHARETGACWDRPFFELFEWGMIEPESGRFNFHMTDEYIRRAHKYGFHILANNPGGGSRPDPPPGLIISSSSRPIRRTGVSPVYFDFFDLKSCLSLFSLL